MKWNYYKDIQPEHGRLVVQVYPNEGNGYRIIGMMKYYQTCSSQDLMKHYEDNDLTESLRFWWVYAEDFPFPDSGCDYNDNKCSK